MTTSLTPPAGPIRETAEWRGLSGGSSVPGWLTDTALCLVHICVFK